MEIAAKATAMRSVDIQSTQDSVVKAIQGAIFSGELKLGQRIMEEELAATFQISRATVREALRRLEQVGLVQIKPRRGTFVTRLTLTEIERTCRLRAALEGLAARYASERLTERDWRAVKQVLNEMKAAAETRDLATFLKLDRRFHELIWTLADDDQLTYVLRFLSSPYFAFVASVSTLLLSDVRKIYRAHEKYLKVLRGRHPEQVRKKVQEIHERLARGFMAGLRKAQAATPGQIFRIEDEDKD
jgi:DNA-binding GntR family transcriptional regulator